MQGNDKNPEKTEAKKEEDRVVFCHDVKDCVDEWGYESFPASDPPSHGSSYRRRMREEEEAEK